MGPSRLVEQPNVRHFFFRAVQPSVVTWHPDASHESLWSACPSWRVAAWVCVAACMGGCMTVGHVGEGPMMKTPLVRVLTSLMRAPSDVG